MDKRWIYIQNMFRNFLSRLDPFGDLSPLVVIGGWCFKSRYGKAQFCSSQIQLGRIPALFSTSIWAIELYAWFLKTVGTIGDIVGSPLALVSTSLTHDRGNLSFDAQLLRATYAKSLRAMPVISRLFQPCLSTDTGSALCRILNSWPNLHEKPLVLRFAGYDAFTSIMSELFSWS